MRYTGYAASRRAGLAKAVNAAMIIAAFISAVPPHEALGGTQRRGLFVTVLQDPAALSCGEETAELVEFARSAGVEDLFVQVYCAGRSWFRSSAADSSPYEECLARTLEDPFRLLLSRAHRYDIRVHAWVNLLSLGNNSDAPILKRYGPEALTRDRKEKRSLGDYMIDGQYFLEPGDPRVRRELGVIVKELVQDYPELDGILFDYIRYPDLRPAYGYTQANLQLFREAHGRDPSGESDKAWKDWRRGRVSGLVLYLASIARAAHPGIEVSATGCMPYVRAYYEAYQDWPSWLRDGTVDFVAAMSYSPDPDEFRRWLRKAGKVSGGLSKVRVGVGAYKMRNSPGIFAQELKICEESGCGGPVVFAYGDLAAEPQLRGCLAGAR
jgi:uncharacterized lipoprotein YddW (UPF0748 family)